MFDDAGRVGLGQRAVPDALRIHDSVGTVEARTEATCWCDEDICRPAKDQQSLNLGEHRGATTRTACGFSARPTVGAHEQMSAGHPSTIFVVVVRCR